MQLEKNLRARGRAGGIDAGDQHDLAAQVGEAEGGPLLVDERHIRHLEAHPDALAGKRRQHLGPGRIKAGIIYQAGHADGDHAKPGGGGPGLGQPKTGLGQLREELAPQQQRHTHDENGFEHHHGDGQPGDATGAGVAAVAPELKVAHEVPQRSALGRPEDREQQETLVGRQRRQQEHQQAGARQEALPGGFLPLSDHRQGRRSGGSEAVRVGHGGSAHGPDIGQCLPVGEVIHGKAGEEYEGEGDRALGGIMIVGE